MKLVEDVIPITTVATREEILAWCEERRAGLTALVDGEDLARDVQLELVDDERRAA